MRQIAQYQDGRLELQEVPQPTAPPGGILVRLTHSVISVGTEKMKVEQAAMSLLQKARARPDQLAKVLDTARTLGWRAALQKVRNRLELPSPLGYSAAGIVEAVDSAHTRLQVGDRVAIGGAECAHHAEFAAVPDLLAAKVPDGVENWQAAYTTIVSIALQAVRRLEPQVGDRVLVVGQGLVGLLVSGLLRASGARVMATDIAAARRPFAQAMGAEVVVIPAGESLRERVRAWTDGYGVDAVVLAASSSSNDPTERALEALRDRGRVVVVGKTKVDLQWTHAYGKEIDVRFSRSYGPGRYDSSYELAGVDYPIGYVRWTEQRNFEACLELMRRGALELRALTTRRLPFGQAVDAYRDLLTGASQDVGIVLEYEPAPVHAPRSAQCAQEQGASEPSVIPGVGRLWAHAHVAAPAARLSAPVSHLDVIGAGNFARTMLLPHLAGRVRFGAVVNHTALSANHVMRKFGFTAAGTDPSTVLNEASSAAVLIATRHRLHAPLVTAALGAHRHVFVEKPLCLTRAELDEIERALSASRGSLQVGFNRRFAGAATTLKSLLDGVPGPKTASFRVMAGALDPEHWFADYQESGGRILGEACHFLDFFCFLFGSSPVRVQSQTLWPATGRTPFPDSVAAQVEFEDGSCGQLIYSAGGDPSWPKEVCTVFAAGVVAEIENFKRLVIHKGRRRIVKQFNGKGHEEEMRAWASFLAAQAPHPQPFEDIRRSTLLTFAVLKSIRERRPVDPREPDQERESATAGSEAAAQA